MKYRVKQVADKYFIPQCKECWLFVWENIDRNENFTWPSESWTGHSSLDEAIKTVERYKAYLENKKQYPKYYKI